MSTTAPGAIRSRWLALAVLCSGMLMIILDGSIVTVAMPAMRDDLGFSPAGLAWVVDAYLIAFGGLLLLAGRLGDLVGRKRVFLAGLTVFTLASLLCGLADSAGMLVAARFAQGVGGAMASAVSLGMIVMLFPEARERARAIGAFSFVGSAGASIGQVLGGVLTDVLSWHWIFFINLPIGVAAVALAARVLDTDRGLGLRAGADLPGALLVTAGLMLMVYTLVEASRYGWGSAHTMGFGALAVALLAAFVVRQRKASAPLLPLRVFSSRVVSGANLVQFLMVAAMFTFQVMVAQYMQNVLGYGAAASGVAMLPAALMIGVLSLGFSARLNARFGARRVLLSGLGLLVVGLALLTRAPVDGGYPSALLPTMLLVGGFGLAMPALTGLGMSGATTGDAGVVSGLFNTGQQVGGALGVAALSTVVASRTDALLGGGVPRAAALTGGYQLAFGVAAALIAAAAVLAAALLHEPRPTPATDPSDQFAAGPV